ncbi:RNA-binding domain-containing protein [Cypionkella sp.]|uniref:RNA-binding domain-containing protein n=1 Tax=Cypionkella sp. TaxID=2811411 RepID=UPI00271BC54F|nr:RNA-binding domain-containing protein [Cypionkella sp.]MDO8982313.1 putative DNA binding domain-containing protein [Cypionkella sp.]MDP2048504.1 putative DNA binding domain-containing protein [Cypionkella sp.]
MSKSSDNLIDRLKNAVDDRLLLPAVIDLLIPSGRPYDTETQLFDYKIEAPILDAQPTKEDKEKHAISIAELIKDAVAFYNAFGGYVVFGVADKGPSRLVGVRQGFNCADFNKTLQRYSGCSVECLYNTIETKVQGDRTVSIGILLVPRRPSGAPPIKMQRKGPEKSQGKVCFGEEIYIRVRDECRPAANTHEDWQFLHSDRLPPEQDHNPVKRQIQSFLPARDEDLLEFVGRSEHLASLRQWIADPRSPIRLITGIGGLGKTTLAYYFAEEVVKVGAGGVDAVLWLTAKQQTYSALRGKLVPTTRVDFFDAKSLFEKILQFLNYEVPLDDDEPTEAEVVDRVVEALNVYPAMIVVDDLDSLSPDEQKEIVAALNSVALRTVGRDMPPSRILMTSRLDQGLPLTSIIKIRGLERAEFTAYFDNITGAFGLGAFERADVGRIFAASSGSPLFSASILRLIKLGENRSEVVERWRGADGEDVRSFAFERELSRLTGLQARVLYATLLLGETSLADIAEVLDMSAKSVRDQISELQAYHLISTNARPSGDSIISAPDELKAIIGLVKDSLAGAAKQVSEAVARANIKGGANEKAIGFNIRTIARAWSEGRGEEALVEAKTLGERFPNNADVASVLGAAFLRVRPSKFKEADLELARALRLGCKRPELLSSIITAKTGLEDWTGIREYTKSLFSNEFSRDVALRAYLDASDRLIRISGSRGDNARTAEIALEAVEKISAKIRRTRIEQSFLSELTKKMTDLAKQHVDCVERDNMRPGNRIKVFEAVSRISTSDIISADMILKGLDSLNIWWLDVEKRPIVDVTACEILQRMIGKLNGIEARVATGSSTTKIIKQIQDTRRDLEFRGATLQASLG